MNNSFEYITSLQYKLKAAEAIIASFMSGEKYIQMTEEFKKKENSYNKLLSKNNEIIAQLRSDIIDNRNHWFEVFEDMEKEFNKKISMLTKQLKDMEKRALRAERQRDELNDTVKTQRKSIAELEIIINDEKDANNKLRAQLNHNYENSSIPSSMVIKKKKISNNREKTGKKPGAQPGHKGYPRKRQKPTSTILLQASKEILDDKDYKKTNKIITKQLVSIKVVLDVTEYKAEVYRNTQTGEIYHAPFPKGVINDVNYDGSIKAFLFLLNNDCCVSIDKCRRLLSELTDKKLNISKGMINKLSREFAEKSQKEQNEIRAKILSSPVMHTDCTNARENGKNMYVYVSVTPNGEVFYSARASKGHEGVKGTPVEEYQGILVHDHEKTFYRYGSQHQECLSHVQRYLKDCIENEPDKTWCKEMRALITEMISYRNSITDASMNENKISEYEERYSDILNKAQKEYEENPPGKYYRDGYNLYIRMQEYKDEHLLFLHDFRVPSTNNEAERHLRNYKRKQKQAISFRSFDSVEYLCQCMTLLESLRKKEMNIFNHLSVIFN